MIDASDTIVGSRRQQELINANDGRIMTDNPLVDDDFTHESPLLPRTHGVQKNDRFSTAFLASVIASLGSLNFGYTLGYTSPTELELEKDTRLNMSKTQFSWFAVSVY